MSRSESGQSTPRAVVHKRILDAAEAQPDASLEDLASDIAGASIELVEQVLDEYGDPVEASEAADPNTSGGKSAEGGDGGGEAEVTDDGRPTTMEDLSEKQLETLRTVRSRLSATQQEIGEALGLSASAVSSRLQGIEGFEWDDRETFVAELFDAPVLADGQGQTVDAKTTAEIEERLDELETRLETGGADSEAPDLPVDLAHKVVHAVVRSDRIDESEELEVIKTLF